MASVYKFAKAVFFKYFGTLPFARGAYKLSFLDSFFSVPLYYWKWQYMHSVFLERAVPYFKVHCTLASAVHIKKSIILCAL